MNRRRRLSHILSGALLVAALAYPVLTAAPAQAAEVVQDGGFEAAVGDNAPVSDVWEQFDSAYPNVICVVDGNCGDVDEFVKPRTGTHWVWFGGVEAAGHNSYVSQVVRIPPDKAVLSYWLFDGGGVEPYDSTLKVLLDGHVVNQNLEQGTTWEDYVLQTVDVSAFADGGLHTLRFEYVQPSAGGTWLQIDDVSIVASDTIAPDTSATGPAGGIATSLSVPIAFSASEPGSTFQCSIDGGTYAACSSPSTYSVAAGSHTVQVAARDASGNTDASPATVTFKAYDCVTLKNAKAKAKKKVKKLTKALRAAKADDRDAKVERLEKKLKKAKKALRKARRAYEPCR